jgi:hypothetical protein
VGGAEGGEERALFFGGGAGRVPIGEEVGLVFGEEDFGERGVGGREVIGGEVWREHWW